MPNYTKTCSFLHDHYTETYKVVEKFVKNLFYAEKHAFIEKIYVVGTHLELPHRGISIVYNICY